MGKKLPDQISNPHHDKTNLNLAPSAINKSLNAKPSTCISATRRKLSATTPTSFLHVNWFNFSLDFCHCERENL